MELQNIVAVVVSGIVVGSIYVLMASGLSLVWGTLRIFNFAHGVLITIAAYTAWSVNEWIGLAAAVPIAITVTAAAGLAIERFLVRPFMGRPRSDLIVIITTLAGAALGQYAVQLAWGPRLKRLPPMGTGSIDIFGTGTTISVHDLAFVLVAPAAVLALAVFLRLSKSGMAMRAVAQNLDAARLVGIDVQRAYAMTFGIAAALAGVAGVFLGAIFLMTPAMGNEPLLRSFIVVVFGGLGSLPGTVLGAYAIGMLEATSTFLVGLYWTPVILFLVLVAVLLVRPSGLLGRRE